MRRGARHGAVPTRPSGLQEMAVFPVLDTAAAEVLRQAEGTGATTDGLPSAVPSPRQTPVARARETTLAVRAASPVRLQTRADLVTVPAAEGVTTAFPVHLVHAHGTLVETPLHVPQAVRRRGGVPGEDAVEKVEAVAVTPLAEEVVVANSLPVVHGVATETLVGATAVAARTRPALVRVLRPTGVAIPTLLGAVAPNTKVAGDADVAGRPVEAVGLLGPARPPVDVAAIQVRTKVRVACHGPAIP